MEEIIKMVQEKMDELEKYKDSLYKMIALYKKDCKTDESLYDESFINHITTEIGINRQEYKEIIGGKEKMRYVITLQETLEKVIVVEGCNSIEEADSLVNEAYSNGDIVLTGDDMTNVETIDTTESYDDESLTNVIKLKKEM